MPPRRLPRKSSRYKWPRWSGFALLAAPFLFLHVLPPIFRRIASQLRDGATLSSVIPHSAVKVSSYESIISSTRRRTVQPPPSVLRTHRIPPTDEDIQEGRERVLIRRGGTDATKTLNLSTLCWWGRVGVDGDVNGGEQVVTRGTVVGGRNGEGVHLAVYGKYRYQNTMCHRYSQLPTMLKAK